MECLPQADLTKISFLPRCLKICADELGWLPAKAAGRLFFCNATRQSATEKRPNEMKDSYEEKEADTRSFE